MKNKDKLTRNIIWGVISFQTILTGIFFIIQVLRIYFGGPTGDSNQIYTPEKVGNALIEILALIIIWFIVVIVVIIMSFIKKLDDKRISKNSQIYKLNTILSNIEINDISELDNDYILLKKEKRNRIISWTILTCILLVCALMSFLYLFNPEHFVSSGLPNQQVIQIVIHLSPWVGIGFIFGILEIVYESYSAKKSINYAKILLKRYKKKDYTVETDKKRELITLWSIRGVFLTVAIVFIIIGVINGGPISVLNKAAKICSECIGLG